jgi:phosphatidylserine decarboxylase
LTQKVADAIFTSDIDMLLLFAKYGWKELIYFSVLWIALGAGLWVAPAGAHYALFVPAVGLLFTLSFFRDPIRRVPTDPGLLVSPADGTVVEISEVDETEYLKARCTKIGIFLSVFNVHINRSPCAGPVRATQYRPGKFLDARHPDSSSQNESNTLHIGDVVVKQIAGLIARRIVCEAKPDDVLERGQKFGMIKFGSRTELYIPKDHVKEINIKLKDKVKGGKTVIARVR